ncbi:PIG-L family deacetylase [Pseudomonas sp. R5(2019)]|nr:PIG-L family deacetylase [Pseudomonas sp. R5(2019)]
MQPRAGISGLNRKQQLLKRHRRNKRLGLLVGLVLLVVVGVLVAWWLPLLLAVLAWVAHEAWFADHLFYAPDEDYRYRFPDDSEQPPVRFEGGRLLVEQPLQLDGSETLILQIRLKSGWLGRFLDPAVALIADQQHDRQTFERGVKGLRYLNLSGMGTALGEGRLRLRGRFCRLLGQPTLWVFRHPDYRHKRVMVIAPHADDAELAAYGLYSQAAQAWIVTLTAGEIEAEHYQQMGLERAAAAQLKGRLRAWDSIAVPRWAGVPEAQCVQLGYFCLQLPAMQAAPDQPIGSREAETGDTRPFRQLNSLALPGDDGVPSWSNLLADLRAMLLKARPQVIVMPHPTLDPHPDHLCAQQALMEALRGLDWQPEALLGYANHLHDNDRWPMGDTGAGVALPPVLQGDEAWLPYSLSLDGQRQCDKAMALGMMHDLQPRPPLKRRLRRVLQRLLAGRHGSKFGENEFFRKAVRRHELFWVVKHDADTKMP